MLHKFRNYIEKLRSYFNIDSNNHRRTVFLAGTGRSGTTWIEEIINSRNEFRIMFEPFHSKKVDLFSNWNYRQYIRCNDRRDKFLKPATTIFRGEIEHKWIDMFKQEDSSRKKRLIKDIRAQLFLKWIKCNFPKIPIILLLRHPCAVANSKLKLGWESHLDDFLIQDKLMNDYLAPFKDEIEHTESMFEKHIFMWCIENYIPLKQFKKGEILVIFYENLCIDPEDEIKKIFSFIGENYSSDILKDIIKPSALSRKESAIISGDNLLDSWREDISEDQIKRAVEICSIFGLQQIYNENTMPLLNDDEALNIL